MKPITLGAVLATSAVWTTVATGPAVAQPPAAAPSGVFACADGVTIEASSLEDGNGPQAWIDGRGSVARAYSGEVPVHPAALRGTAECSASFSLQGNSWPPASERSDVTCS
jgi:hypothetical protein